MVGNYTIQCKRSVFSRGKKSCQSKPIPTENWLSSLLNSWKIHEVLREGSTSWPRICTETQIIAIWETEHTNDMRTTNLSKYVCVRFNKRARRGRVESSCKTMRQVFTLCWLYFSLIAGKLELGLLQQRRWRSFTQTHRSEGWYSV